MRQPTTGPRPDAGNAKHVPDLFRTDLGQFDVGQRGKALVRGPQQQAAQPDEVAGNLDVDDLPPAVPHLLVGASPSVAQDVRGVMVLPFLDEVSTRLEGDGGFLQRLKHRFFPRPKREKGAKLESDGVH